MWLHPARPENSGPNLSSPKPALVPLPAEADRSSRIIFPASIRVSTGVATGVAALGVGGASPGKREGGRLGEGERAGPGKSEQRVGRSASPPARYRWRCFGETGADESRAPGPQERRRSKRHKSLAWRGLSRRDASPSPRSRALLPSKVLATACSRRRSACRCRAEFRRARGRSCSRCGWRSPGIDREAVGAVRLHVEARGAPIGLSGCA